MAGTTLVSGALGRGGDGRARPGGTPEAARVLHVVPGMTWGGIEAWLLQVLARADRQRWQMDFLDAGGSGCPHLATLAAHGARRFAAPPPRRPRAFAARFAAVLREHGPYRIVHSHMHYADGYVLRLAAARGVEMRIAHCHNDTRALEAAKGWPRRAVVALLRRWIGRHATAGLAVSADAAADLFGPGWAGDGRFQVLHCGLDLAPFAGPAPDRAAIRAGLGLPGDALVLGHVGHFLARKNHRFLLEVAAEACRREPRARLLLLGTGPLEAEMRARAEALGIASRVVFAGARPDVPSVMRAAMDVFVLPSLHEGLALVLMEAQAAGLPCLRAAHLSPEADVVAAQVHALPLEAPPAAWAETALAAARLAAVAPEAALAAMRASPFTIEASVDRLLGVYGAGAAAKESR